MTLRPDRLSTVLGLCVYRAWAIESFMTLIRA
jgi:hypothetical protein